MPDLSTLKAASNVPVIGGVAYRSLNNDDLEGTPEAVMPGALDVQAQAGWAMGGRPGPLLRIEHDPALPHASTDSGDRRPMSADEAERLRAELPTLRDHVLWGLLYAAGLRTEEALAVRWRDVLGLSRSGRQIAVDRRFVAGQMLEGTTTGPGRDVDVITPLAEDIVALYQHTMDNSVDNLVCASRRGTPVHLDNWRNRILNPAKRRAGVAWATPSTGRHTFISLQIHAGMSPVLVAARSGTQRGRRFGATTRASSTVRAPPSRCRCTTPSGPHVGACAVAVFHRSSITGRSSRCDRLRMGAKCLLI